MNLILPTAKFMQLAALKLFANLEVINSENVPPFGPVIIVANHQSSADPPLITATAPRRVSFLAKRDIFSGPIVSWLLVHGWSILRVNNGDTCAVVPTVLQFRKPV